MTVLPNYDSFSLKMNTCILSSWHFFSFRKEKYCSENYTKNRWNKLYAENKYKAEQDWRVRQKEQDSVRPPGGCPRFLRLQPSIMNSFKSFVKTMADKAPEGFKAAAGEEHQTKRQIA